ncbi:TDT family transporter [Rhizobium sp. Leaf321]|uniref:TDT family transporter n=1 Tax=Rhizobium sp. Leaf321 TaxID=1736335 RepID=UPI0009EB430E|nr:TDT family transporter [Rhizobium sp. Leaf321]
MQQVVAFQKPITPAADVPMQGHVIRNFTPNWFATTMGTGILSVALAQFPGHPWLFAVGLGLWLFNILLFATCTVLYAARWTLYFHEASQVFSHSVVSMFFGCIPMGLATIINGFLIYGIPHIGDTAVTIATTLWWIDVILSLACGLAIPFMMFTRQSHSIDQMTAVWLLPIVASEVAAVSGGLLLPHITGAQTQLTVLMTSLVLWACSVPLAMSVLVILFLRMAVHKLPHVNMAASSWLALGPIGTGALGLLVMSQTGPAVLAANGLASVAPAFGGASFLGAILLWGYGIWWLATAVLITLRYLREGLPFNIGWWGYTFPLGVFAVATLRLSTVVPISAIAVFGAVLVTALACMWLLVAAKTTKGALDRSLFIAPCLKAD